jgi:hypothetical protein
MAHNSFRGLDIRNRGKRDSRVRGAVGLVCILSIALSTAAIGQGPPRPKPLTIDHVVKLLDGDVSAERVGDLAKERGIDFEFTPEIESQVRAILVRKGQQQSSASKLISVFRGLSFTNTSQFDSKTGDLGVQSGPIASSHMDLEALRHKGDRNYYAFTLLKGAQPQPVSTVSLQLKNVDTQAAMFTLTVTSDDKTIEKKDRRIGEPIQFYSGRDHLLFELVIWAVDKSKATGYLSTPKGAPVPRAIN